MKALIAIHRTNLLIVIFCCMPYLAVAQDWYNATDLGLTGQAWSELLHPYDRLPVKAKEVVRGPVWKLGTNTAGLSVHFKTNSSSIRVKWKVRYQNAMWHMTNCGIRGIDLYMKQDGKWCYAGSGSPGGDKSNEGEIIKDLDGSMHEFHINLPLYDGIDSLFIGVEPGSRLEESNTLSGKPLVVYGTSIQQGGCATRPGMASTNILMRQLNREVINLGFSGNGRMEMEVAELIAEINTTTYILNYLPNIHNLNVIVPRYVSVVTYLRGTITLRL